MVILYRTAKFKSASILAIAILGSTAKFNSRQYFRVFDIRIGHIILPGDIYAFLYMSST